MSKEITMYKGDISGDDIGVRFINWNNMSEVSSNNGELRLTHVEQGLEMPFIVREAITQVNNIYSGTDIDPSAYASTRRGVSLLLQINQNIKVTDTEDPDYEVLLPVQAHLVLKLPVTDLLSTADVESITHNLVATLYSTESDGKEVTSRLGKLLRGALVPAMIAENN